jgi:hypothetical protein
MSKWIAGWLVVFCLLSVGCSDKNSVPSGILPVEKMYPILWDMIEADQYAGLLPKDTAHVNIKMEHLRLYEQVLQLHNISRQKFQKSYDYYKEHPELNQVLYDSLIAQGSRLRTEAYSHPVVNNPIAPPHTRVPPTVPTPIHPGMPIIHPFIKPDTLHRKPLPNSLHPASHPSATPPAKTPAA